MIWISGNVFSLRIFTREVKVVQSYCIVYIKHRSFPSLCIRDNHETVLEHLIKSDEDIIVSYLSHVLSTVKGNKLVLGSINGMQRIQVQFQNTVCSKYSYY